VEQEYYSQALGELKTELPADLVSFLDPETSREFMAKDDGRPFYVINVFRFKEQASALVQNGSGLTGREAFAEFSQRAVPLWLRYGTHPVFATNDSPAFDEEWDLVSVVRYRSRRDFMEIQTNPEFHSILPYRLAATEDNIRLKLPATLIPSPLLVLLLVLLLPLLVVPLLSGRRLAAGPGYPGH